MVVNHSNTKISLFALFVFFTSECRSTCRIKMLHDIFRICLDAQYNVAPVGPQRLVKIIHVHVQQKKLTVV